MISQPTIFGSFNARWLNARDVAKTFVPVPQFRQLTHDNHSVLLGPRGCGKTTLLKMLTRPALSQWSQSEKALRFKDSFSAPAYEAIYIPSDVRWCYELSSLTEDASIDTILSTKSQRVMVSINTLVNLLNTVDLLPCEDRAVEAAIAERLIKRWDLKATLSNYRDVRSTLLDMASSIRGFLAVADMKSLVKLLDRVHPSFFAHALDAPFDTIQTVTDNLPAVSSPQSWALCFDELEIAPEWLRKELLESLRSVNQNVFLKLTWSPILPSGLRTSPESAADFKAIRLWHSHLADPKVFCENLTKEFLRERLPNTAAEPLSFFSRSILASDEDDEPIEAYNQQSTEYEIFKHLATWDLSFRRLLIDHKVNPDNPVPQSVEEKDKFFRKLKPIAILRSEFLSPTMKARTRKAVTVYAGREAIYAMSEGNPRWLLGLLNDFVDLGLAYQALTREMRVSYSDQARILNNSARRLLAQINASPFRAPLRAAGDQNYTLYDFITKIGQHFRSEVLGHEFQLDPPGSFVVNDTADPQIISLAEQLLEIGALVYVGSSPQDVPISVVGSRFRLSYMLAPIFRLPLRLYHEVPLRDVLAGGLDKAQIELFSDHETRSN